MKRRAALVMAILMLVFALTACGRKDTQQGGSSQDNSTENGTSQNDSAIVGGESNSNSGNSEGAQSGAAGGESQSPVGEGIDDIRDSIGSVVDDITGSDNSGGVSYEQMLRNGKVHDRDGNLNDHENASTPGAF